MWGKKGLGSHLTCPPLHIRSFIYIQKHGRRYKVIENLVYKICVYMYNICFDLKELSKKNKKKTPHESDLTEFLVLATHSQEFYDCSATLLFTNK